jgi:FkbM family methyltransferase
VRRLWNAARAVARHALPRRLVEHLQHSDWYLRRHYCERLAAFDARDEPDLRVALALVRHGDLAVDVGANIGVYTRFLSRRVGRSGRVWSLEPVPFTYSVLCHNVRALRLRNVVPLPYAATAADAPLTMELPQAESGHLDIYVARVAAPAEGRPVRRVPVQGRSLDSVWSQRGGRPAFIKIDVEGHEAACLRGAARIVEACRPALLVEMTSDLDIPGEAAELLHHAGSLGYGCFWWDGTRLRSRRPGDRHVNHFFLQPGHLEQLAAEGVPLSG